MIQRLQTIWLLIASALAFISLKVSFFSGNIMVDNVKQFQKFTALSNLFLMILTVVVGAGALLTVFLYKDRKLQLRITTAIFVVSILNLVLYYLQTKNFIPIEWSFNFTALLSLAIPVFLFLAIKGISKDDKLIRSVDRLR